MSHVRSSSGFPTRRPTPFWSDPGRPDIVLSSACFLIQRRPGRRPGTTSTPWRRRSAPSGSCSTPGNALRVAGRREPGGLDDGLGCGRRGPEAREPLRQRGRRTLSGWTLAATPSPRSTARSWRRRSSAGSRWSSHPTVGRSRLQPARTPDLSPYLPRGRLPRLVVHGNRRADRRARRSGGGAPLLAR